MSNNPNVRSSDFLGSYDELSSDIFVDATTLLPQIATSVLEQSSVLEQLFHLAPIVTSPDDNEELELYASGARLSRKNVLPEGQCVGSFPKKPGTCVLIEPYKAESAGCVRESVAITSVCRNVCFAVI